MEPQGKIEEAFYPLDFDGEKMVAALAPRLALPYTSKKRKGRSEQESGVVPASLSKWAEGIAKKYPSNMVLCRKLGEQLLVKRKGDLPLIILRPGIVGAAWRAPQPGWIDTLSPLAAMFLLAGGGGLQTLRGDLDTVVDFTPVDLLANAILIALPVYNIRWGLWNEPDGSPTSVIQRTNAVPKELNEQNAQEAGKCDFERSRMQLAFSMGSKPGKKLAIQVPYPVSPGVVVHVTTSGNHPCRWGVARRSLLAYFATNPLSSPHGSGHPQLNIKDRSRLSHSIARFVRHNIITSALAAAAPIIPSRSLKKAAESAKDSLKAYDEIAGRFQHYLTNSWQFENQRLTTMHKVVGQAFKELQQSRASCSSASTALAASDSTLSASNPLPSLVWLDARLLDWEEWFLLFAYGMQKWILLEAPVVAPVASTSRAELLLSRSSLPHVPGTPLPLENEETASQDDVLTGFGSVQKSFKADVLYRARAQFLDQKLSSLRFVLTASPTDHSSVPPALTIKAVLNRPQVSGMIQKLASENGTITSPKQLEKNMQQWTNKAIKILEFTAANHNRKAITAFAWGLHKVVKSIFSRVVVDKRELAGLLSLRRQDGPLLLLPSHRSYVDFLILSYLCYTHDMKMPFIAAGDDFSKMGAGVNKLLQNSGAFFMRRSMRGATPEAQLYTTCFKTYFQQVICEHGVIEFFPEGTRSRSGYMLSARKGLLKWALEPLLEGRVRDIQIVPVSISYDRVLESKTFPREMLGEAKVKESVTRVLKGASVLKECLGDLHIRISDPISAKQVLLTEAAKEGIRVPLALLAPLSSTSNDDKLVAAGLHERKDDAMPLPPNIPEQAPFMAALPPRILNKLLDRLGNDVLNSLSSKMVISPSAIISSLLLFRRRGLPFSELVRLTAWLRGEVQARGVDLSFDKAILDSSSPTGVAVVTETHRVVAEVGGLPPAPPSHTEDVHDQRAIAAFIQEARQTFMSDLLAPEQPLRPGMSKGDVIVAPAPNFEASLLLAYYRNTLIHVFLNEAFIAVALFGLIGGGVNSNLMLRTVGVPVSRLVEEAAFLVDILAPEFEVPSKISRSTVQDIVLQMVSRGSLEIVFEPAASSKALAHVVAPEELPGKEGSSLLHPTPAPADKLTPPGMPPGHVAVVRATSKSMTVELPYLASLLWPFVEAYWMTASSLHELVPPSPGLPVMRTFTSRSFSRHVQWVAEELKSSNVSLFDEARALSTLQFSIATFIHLRVLQQTQPSPDIRRPATLPRGDAKSLPALASLSAQKESRKKVLSQLVEQEEGATLRLSPEFEDGQSLRVLVDRLALFRKEKLVWTNKGHVVAPGKLFGGSKL